MTGTAHKTFSTADIQALSAAMKVGLLATVNPDGLPHLTLLASLQANTPTQMVFGQFTEGRSKAFIRENPRAGWLVMTLDRQLWRGTADFTHTATQGPEFEMYNNTPMFRYNAYFGVHTVYYLDLVAHTGRQALPMGRVVLAAVQTMLARALSGRRDAAQVLNPWTQALMNKLDNLKFVAYVGADGYPVVIPAIQAQAADAEHILFSTGAYGDELVAISAGATVAVFGMSLQMEDVLLRGEFEGIRRVGGVRCGRVRVDWVYSPMPPKAQQIYPLAGLEAVRRF
ncbi:MAG: pyridoxamine 5'-phosphate oxidase family protein [Anaerolineae bacterium]